ncbi:DMT family transporter [Parafrankia elaeagni]|uniref:DMT family transporter n=1 Tax=Parafrankia elaeagni TaxID=222534 RepID=UPI000366D731|nr:DMT family transporter [Parafrankia elaeagni]
MLTTYLLGLGSAVCFGVAAVIQQRVAFHAPPEDVLRLRLLLWLVRRPMWDLGVLLSAVGTFASAAALARSTVAFVAPLQVCQLLFALPLAAFWARRRVPRRDWLAAMATALGLATFLLAGDPHQGEVEAATTLGWILTGGSIGGLAAWSVLGTRRLDPARRATLLAGGAGLLSALQGALIGSVGRLVETSGIGAVPTSWQTYAVVVVALSSGLLLQSAYEMAPLPASLPAAVSLEPLGGVAIGVFLLGGMLRLNPLAIAGEIAGLAIMILGVRALAASPLVTGQLSRLRARTSQGQLSRLEDLLHRDLELLRDDLIRGRRASTDRAQRRQCRRLHNDLDRIHCELARLVDDRDHLDSRIQTMRAGGRSDGHCTTAVAGVPGTTPAEDAPAGETVPNGSVPNGSVPGGLEPGGLEPGSSARSAEPGTLGTSLRRLSARVRLRTALAAPPVEPTPSPRDTTPAPGGRTAAIASTGVAEPSEATTGMRGRGRRSGAGRPSARVPRGTAPRPVRTPGGATPPAAPHPHRAQPVTPGSSAAPPRAGRVSARAGRAEPAQPGSPPRPQRTPTGASAPGPAASPPPPANGPAAGRPDASPDVVSDHDLAASQRALDARADALLSQAEELSVKAETVLRSLAGRPPAAP